MLNFGNGASSGFCGCNTYTASCPSTLAAGNTSNISVGPVTSTKLLCPEEIISQEQANLASLQPTSSHAIAGSTMTLTTAGGALTFGSAVALPYAAPAVSQKTKREIED